MKELFDFGDNVCIRKMTELDHNTSYKINGSSVKSINL